MAVKIGNETVVVKEVEKPEAKEVVELTVVEKLKLVKKQLEEKYEAVAVFKLPNSKRIFVRPPTQIEYQMYIEKIERVAWQKQNPTAKSITADTFSDCKTALVKPCVIDLGENDIVGNITDLLKYPAAIGSIADKLDVMAGGEVEEDFLD